MDVSGGRHFLDEIAECTSAVIALGASRIELKQRALQQPELWRHFAIRQNFQRAPDKRECLGKAGIRDGRAGSFRSAALSGGRRNQVLVGDEFMAVLL